MRPHLGGLRYIGGLVDFETPQRHHWIALARLDFAQARHDLRAEKVDGTIPLVKPEAQIENDMIDADFDKLPHLIHDVLRTSGDEGPLQIFRRSKRTRSGLHPYFLFVGVREQSVEVDLFNGCLAVLVDAGNRNAALMQSRPALSGRRAAKFFHAFAIGGHSNPAGQPAITIFHRAAYCCGCGSGVPDFKLRGVFGFEAHVVKAIKLTLRGSVIPIADFPQNRYLFAHDFVAGPLTHADGIKLLLKRSKPQAQQQSVPSHITQRVEHQGEQNRVPVWNQRAKAQFDFGSRGPERSQDDERVNESIVRAFHSMRMEYQMVSDPNGIKAHLLRAPGSVNDAVSISFGAEVG